MKSIIIGCVLFQFSLSTWAGNFLETFDDGEIEVWQELILFNLNIGRSSWEIVDGELQGIVPLGITHLLTRSDEVWQDYDIEFDVKPLEKHGPGNFAIAARVRKNSAVWCLVGDTPTIVIAGDVPAPKPESKVSCWSGNFQNAKKMRVFKSKPSPLLKINKWSTLKLSLHGNNLSFWINGKLVLESGGEFPDFLRGGFGLGLASYTARFDNIVITEKGHFLVTPHVKLATAWGQLKQF